MIAAMFLVAVLFVAFVLIRPPAGCSHECRDCAAPCDVGERLHGRR